MKTKIASCSVYLNLIKKKWPRKILLLLLLLLLAAAAAAAAAPSSSFTGRICLPGGFARARILPGCIARLLSSVNQPRGDLFWKGDLSVKHVAFNFRVSVIQSEQPTELVINLSELTLILEFFSSRIHKTLRFNLL